MLKNYFFYIKKTIKISIYKSYKIKIPNKNIVINYTNKNITSSDLTLLMFYIKQQIPSKKSYQEIGLSIGNYLCNNIKVVASFNIVKGFLNILLSDIYYINVLCNKKYKYKNKKKNIMIEFCSPNTNKPLHLGHLRNILIGNSLYNIYKYQGCKVLSTQIINDRGIHICQSMLSWIKFGNNKSPNNIKGDHFVGEYYTLFHKKLNIEINKYIKLGYSKKEAETKSNLLKESKKLLIKWENNDYEVMNIWKKMNSWVYEGFKNTYNKLNINFDIEEYESDIYKQGKKIILQGLKNKIFYQEKDKSIWVDLEKENLGKKLLLRSDGTSLYITQDIATLIHRFKNYNIDILIYVVGKEQEHYFKILFTIIYKLGISLKKKIYHLSYEMVYLPTGKMKSREGTIIDIDGLIKNINNKVFEKKKINNTDIVSKSALKYYFLQIDPKKKITFNINSSIDLKGKTGPYIQYTYVRICSINKKFKKKLILHNFKKINLNVDEKNILKILDQFNYQINNASKNMNPSIIANYAYDLSKSFNEYYENTKIIDKFFSKKTFFKVHLSFFIGKVLKILMNILGINMPHYM